LFKRNQKWRTFGALRYKKSEKSDPVSTALCVDITAIKTLTLLFQIGYFLDVDQFLSHLIWPYLKWVSV
jgi:hypothetical protein